MSAVDFFLCSLYWFFKIYVEGFLFLFYYSCPASHNPFGQFVQQPELYSQLQLSLLSDPITFSVPKSTWWVLVKIQGDGKLAETQMKKWW